jgi:hypothetical protein
MRRIAGFAVTVSLLSLVGPAHAGQVFSPPLWTDVGNAATCYVRNISTKPVKVQVNLFSNNEIVPGDINDTCNIVPLAGGTTCMIAASAIPDDSWAACSMKASNINIDKLRGNIDIRHPPTGGNRVVVGADLQ